MPKTDAYGQGVQIATRTDAMDGAKLADDLATGIVPRSVLRFATEAERNATVTSPVRGMIAYVSSIDSFTGYTAGGWVVLAAGSQAWATVSLVSGWSSPDADSVNNNQGRLRYRVVNLFGDPTVMFKGGIGRTSYPTGFPARQVITSTPLPVGARPSALRSCTITCSDASSNRIGVKLDVQPSGNLELLGFESGVRPPWISFHNTFVSLS